MIGLMHDEEEARGTYPAFALDHMEPLRSVIDQAILHLVDGAGLSAGIDPSALKRSTVPVVDRDAASARRPPIRDRQCRPRLLPEPSRVDHAYAARPLRKIRPSGCKVQRLRNLQSVRHDLDNGRQFRLRLTDRCARIAWRQNEQQQDIVAVHCDSPLVRSRPHLHDLTRRSARQIRRFDTASSEIPVPENPSGVEKDESRKTNAEKTV